ncbi:MAG TPA: hypothetical protein VNN18_05100 [Candidatus Xenobia bacterium]|nr:hypothetical protein [Candidatus Xenobia bacterium]
MRVVAAFALVLTLASTVSAASPSPAEQKIAEARQAIEKNPGDYNAYNRLAAALARRARETSDPSYYLQGQEALKESLRLQPDNFEARKWRAWLLLGRHEFAAALKEARQLAQVTHEDLEVYGFLVDANVELGNYAAAEEAAQWMLDLRPGNVPGLTRAAYLRELFGDLDGALELMVAAYQRTPATEREDRAWLLTQQAHLELLRGNLERADSLLGLALGFFPDYHYALAQQAKVRSAQGRDAEAVESLRRLCRVAPHAENLYLLAHALERAGEKEEAARTFARFEQLARAEMDNADNANHELVFYYTDHAGKPAEALEVARKELARRRDVYTLDAYAWALHANGKLADAQQAIQSALAVGVRDPRILGHAEAIAARTAAR